MTKILCSLLPFPEIAGAICRIPFIFSAENKSGLYSWYNKGNRQASDRLYRS